MIPYLSATRATLGPLGRGGEPQLLGEIVGRPVDVVDDPTTDETLSNPAELTFAGKIVRGVLDAVGKVHDRGVVAAAEGGPEATVLCPLQ